MKHAGVFIILIILFFSIFFHRPLKKIFSQIPTMIPTIIQKLVEVSVEVINENNHPIINLFAYPQNRDLTTFSTNGILEIRTVGTTQVLQTYNNIITDNVGYYPLLTLENLPGGTYDLVFKGYSHIKKKVAEISLLPGDVNDDINFGTLYAGDVMTSPEEPFGNNKINSLDMTYLVSQWDSEDTGPSENRADLDENGLINSLDGTLLTFNWDLVGD